MPRRIDRPTEQGVPETAGEVLVDGRQHAIEIDRAGGSFVVRVGQHVATLEFDVAASVLSLIHTEVPAALSRRGVGTGLARAALDFARAHHLTVMPYCPFVAAYIRRHPEYGNLVDPAFPWRHGGGR